MTVPPRVSSSRVVLGREVRARPRRLMTTSPADSLSQPTADSRCPGPMGPRRPSLLCPYVRAAQPCVGTPRLCGPPPRAARRPGRARGGGRGRQRSQLPPLPTRGDGCAGNRARALSPFLREGQGETSTHPGGGRRRHPERIAAESAAFDSGVVSLVLCSVSDAGAALAELHRVIRPGGELRFLEHVRADSPSLRRIQRLMDASVWPRLTGGCHASRDSATAIQTAGFSIERLHSFRFPETRIPFPTAPHIVGVARRT